MDTYRCGKPKRQSTSSDKARRQQQWRNATAPLSSEVYEMALRSSQARATGAAVDASTRMVPHDDDDGSPKPPRPQRATSPPFPVTSIQVGASAYHTDPQRSPSPTSWQHLPNDATADSPSSSSKVVVVEPPHYTGPIRSLSPRAQRHRMVLEQDSHFYWVRSPEAEEGVGQGDTCDRAENDTAFPSKSRREKTNGSSNSDARVHHVSGSTGLEGWNVTRGGGGEDDGLMVIEVASPLVSTTGGDDGLPRVTVPQPTSPWRSHSSRNGVVTGADADGRAVNNSTPELRSPARASTSAQSPPPAWDAAGAGDGPLNDDGASRGGGLLRERRNSADPSDAGGAAAKSATPLAAHSPTHSGLGSFTETLELTQRTPLEFGGGILLPGRGAGDGGAAAVERGEFYGDALEEDERNASPTQGGPRRRGVGGGTSENSSTLANGGVPESSALSSLEDKLVEVRRGALSVSERRAASMLATASPGRVDDGAISLWDAEHLEPVCKPPPLKLQPSSPPGSPDASPAVNSATAGSAGPGARSVAVTATFIEGSEGEGTGLRRRDAASTEALNSSPLRPASSQTLERLPSHQAARPLAPRSRPPVVVAVSLDDGGGDSDEASRTARPLSASSARASSVSSGSGGGGGVGVDDFYPQMLRRLEHERSMHDAEEVERMAQADGLGGGEPQWPSPNASSSRAQQALTSIGSSNGGSIASQSSPSLPPPPSSSPPPSTMFSPSPLSSRPLPKAVRIESAPTNPRGTPSLSASSLHTEVPPQPSRGGSSDEVVDVADELLDAASPKTHSRATPPRTMEGSVSPPTTRPLPSGLVAPSTAKLSAGHPPSTSDTERPQPRTPSTSSAAASPLQSQAQVQQLLESPSPSPIHRNLVKRAKPRNLFVALQEYAAAIRSYLAALKECRSRLPPTTNDFVRDVLGFSTSFAKAAEVLKTQLQHNVAIRERGITATLLSQVTQACPTWLGQQQQQQESDEVVYSRLLELIRDEISSVQTRLSNRMAYAESLALLASSFSSALQQQPQRGLFSHTSGDANDDHHAAAASAASREFIDHWNRSCAAFVARQDGGDEGSPGGVSSTSSPIPFARIAWSAHMQRVLRSFDATVSECRKLEVSLALIADLERIYPLGAIPTAEAGVLIGSVSQRLQVDHDEELRRASCFVSSDDVMRVLDDFRVSTRNAAEAWWTVATAAASECLTPRLAFLVERLDAYDQVTARSWEEYAAARVHRPRSSEPVEEFRHLPFISSATTQAHLHNPQSVDSHLVRAVADAHHYSAESVANYEALQDDERYASLHSIGLVLASSLRSRVAQYELLGRELLVLEAGSDRVVSDAADRFERTFSTTRSDADARRWFSVPLTTEADAEERLGDVLSLLQAVVHEAAVNAQSQVTTVQSFLTKRVRMSRLLEEEIDQVRNLVQVPLQFDPELCIWSGTAALDTEYADISVSPQDRASRFADVVQANHSVARANFLLLGNCLLQAPGSGGGSSPTAPAQPAVDRGKVEHAVAALEGVRNAQEVVAASLRRLRLLVDAKTQPSAGDASLPQGSSPSGEGDSSVMWLFGPSGPRLSKKKGLALVDKIVALQRAGVIVFLPNVPNPRNPNERHIVRCTAHLNDDCTQLQFHNPRAVAADTEAVAQDADDGTFADVVIPPLEFAQVELLLQGPTVPLGSLSLQAMRVLAEPAPGRSNEEGEPERLVYLSSIASYMEWTEVLQYLVRCKALLPSQNLAHALGDARRIETMTVAATAR